MKLTAALYVGVAVVMVWQASHAQLVWPAKPVRMSEIGVNPE